MTKYLLVGDTPSIKQFVFGTNKLKEIRGASAILDYLNRHITAQLAEKCLPQCRLIYANGGTFQLMFEAEPDQVESIYQSFRQQLQKKWRESTGNESQVQMTVPVSLESGYSQALKLAYAQLGQLKFQWNIEPGFMHHSLAKDCDSSGLPANICYEGPESDAYLSQASNLKRLAMGNNPEWKTSPFQDIWSELQSQFETWGLPKPRRPEQIEDISNKNVALIYADGNGFGRVIKEITDPETYQRFADTVDHAIRKACHEGLRATFSERQLIASTYLPADILMLGGDDLMVMLPAKHWHRFLFKAAEVFQEATRHVMPDKYPDGFTLSFGVVFAKHAFPFQQMFALAEDLLKAAKKAAPENQKTPGSFIDFQWAIQAGAVRLSELRKSYQQANFTATLRPYSLGDMQLLVEHSQEVAQAKIPRSRLNALYSNVFKGVYQGEIEVLSLLGRTRKADHRKKLQQAMGAFGCMERMPWTSMNQNANQSNETAWKTMAVDLVELLEVVDG